MELAHRRNAELHSGELPFTDIRRDSWVPKFWRVAETILEMQNKSLVDWLGKARAKKAQEEMKLAELKEKIEKRVSQCKEHFYKQYKTNEARLKARKDVSAKILFSHSLFSETPSNACEEVKCPACKSSAVIGGEKWIEENTGEPDEDEPWLEYVVITYSSIAFQCIACGLKINGKEEIKVANLPEEFEHTELREIEYEPYYGND